MTTTTYDWRTDLEDPWSHASFVHRRGESPLSCEIEEADWPYDCDAKKQHPEHTVYVCKTHSCWWHK